MIHSLIGPFSHQLSKNTNIIFRDFIPTEFINIVIIAYKSFKKKRKYNIYGTNKDADNDVQLSLFYFFFI